METTADKIVKDYTKVEEILDSISDKNKPINNQYAQKLGAAVAALAYLGMKINTLKSNLEEMKSGANDIQHKLDIERLIRTLE